MSTQPAPPASIGAMPALGAEHRSLRDQVASVLRERIVSGELAPGTPLVERTLAESLGVSRAPVRDALNLLKGEGFVTQEPRRGVTVRQMSRADLEELIEVRTALEVLAVRLCAQRATAAEVARLEELVAQADAALDAGDGDTLRRCNMAFHDALVTYSHNDLLATMFEPIQGRMHWLLHQNDDSLAVHRGHAELARAIGARDVEAAAAASLEHVRTSRELSLRRLFPEASTD